MQKQPPTNFKISPVKGKQNQNQLTNLTLAEIFNIFKSLKKRIADKERYITFLKAELEENGIEYKNKFRKFKQFRKEVDQDFSIDPLVKAEKNIKKKIKKRNKKRDIRPEVPAPHEAKVEEIENAKVTMVDSVPVEMIPQQPSFASSSVIDVITPLEITEETIQRNKEEIDKEEKEKLKEKQEEEKRMFNSELYLRKVRCLKNSNYLYKEKLLEDKYSLYYMKMDELRSLIETNFEGVSEGVPKEQKENAPEKKNLGRSSAVDEDIKEDKKEIEEILEEEDGLIKEKWNGNEISFYLFSGFLERHLNNKEYRQKKINRIKKLLKKSELSLEDSNDLKQKLTLAKEYKD